MITITRSLARQIRPVFRRALLGLSRGPGPALDLRAGPHGLRVRAHNHQTAIVHHTPGDFPPEQLCVPFQLLADCEGTNKEPVSLERQEDGTVTTQWTDGNVPQVVQYDETDTTSCFPPLPEETGTNDIRLLDALRDAFGTTDPTSARYSLGCIQLRGGEGDIVATDGSQLLVQSGFTFPWDEDLLVLGNTVFGSKELRCDVSVEIGKTDKWITLQSGAWAIQLAVEKERRFPKVHEHIQSIDTATTRLSLTQPDAEFLADAIKRLPNVDEKNEPVTVDLNGCIAVRARADDGTPPTEVVLASSSLSGDALRVNMNRKFLGRAINLGFRELFLYGPELPVQSRDADRVYVWAVLDKDGAIKPSKDAIRIECNRQSSTNTSPTTERTRETMSTSRQSTNGDARNNGNGKSDTAGLTALIEQAEAVKTSLSTALADTKQLVAGLKKHRQQSKALQSTLASLKQLQTLDE